MNSPPSSSRLRTSRFLTLICLLLLPHVTGCISTKLDMRNIENPVMLNALPVGGDAWSARSVDHLKVNSSTENDFWTIGNWETDVESKTNDAELVTFRKVGGDNERAISSFEIKVGGTGMNFFFLVSESAFVEGKGDVVVIESSLSAETGGTEPAMNDMGEAN